MPRTRSSYRWAHGDLCYVTKNDSSGLSKGVVRTSTESSLSCPMHSDFWSASASQTSNCSKASCSRFTLFVLFLPLVEPCSWTHAFRNFLIPQLCLLHSFIVLWSFSSVETAVCLAEICLGWVDLCLVGKVTGEDVKLEESSSKRCEDKDPSLTCQLQINSDDVGIEELIVDNSDEGDVPSSG